MGVRIVIDFNKMKEIINKMVDNGEITTEVYYKLSLEIENKMEYLLNVN